MSVFKYRNAERGLKILRDLEMRLSRPDSFNDPFEFLPLLNPTAMTKERAIQSLNNEKLAIQRRSRQRLEQST